MGRVALRSLTPVGVVIVLMLIHAACASMHSTRFNATPGGQTVAMLNDRMGRMNYDEALQRFGIPTRCAEGETTKVCTWAYPAGPLSGAEAIAAAMNPQAAPTIIARHEQAAPSAMLTFTNGVLSNWALNGNWR